MRGIAAVLSGRDTLLCAPTASGKTEAYTAPLVERILGGSRGGLRLLIVSPTRALANDLKRRLHARLLELGVSFGRYTGEHKELTQGRLPEVVVTTPEALDSLLARRPYVLKTLQSLVIDEVHVLDGTPRGDQLRILLHRLDGVIGGRRVQRIAASATISDPAGLAQRYLEDSEVVIVPGRRQIGAKAFRGTAVTDVARHLQELAGAGFRKILLFCNSRNDVELFAAGLKGRTPFGAMVFPHHGSLARQVRERTERQFLDAPAAVCVATLTLELGIDIGGVDYVLLLAVPPSVSNLLQRIGRGSRRGDRLRAGYAVGDEGSRLLYRVLLTCGARGDLCTDPYAFRPGVLVQQALVLAGAEAYVTPARLTKAVPPAIRDRLPPGFAALVLDRAADADLLEASGHGRYVLSETQDRKYQRGVLHSNIVTARDVPVIDRLTGDLVGGVAPSTGDSSLQLGGAGRRPVALSEGSYLTDTTAGGAPATFQKQPMPGMGFHLAQAVAGELGKERHQILQRSCQDEGFVMLHGLGTAGSLLLKHCLIPVVGKGRILTTTPISMQLACPLEVLPRPTDADLSIFLAAHEKKLAVLCGMGPYHKKVAPELRRQAVRDGAFLDGVAETLREALLVDQLDRPAPGVWELL